MVKVVQKHINPNRWIATSLAPIKCSPGWFLAFLCLLVPLFASAATLIVQTNVVGPTPTFIGYNLGHFYAGGNTRDWWRYSGATCARIFISPSSIEPTDDIAPVGDGVNSAASFMTRRAAIRTNQFNPAYINWISFSNHFANTDLYPVNHIKVDNALTELRSLNVSICAEITGTESRFPITSNTDWPDKWELWQHHYVEAFYLGRVYNVDHYQMYNEPNNGTTLTPDTLLLRMQIAADAIQTAIADVNTLYGKNLTPQLLAPTLAGNSISSYSDWGLDVITNRHVNFFGQTDTNFLLLQKYDCHQYGGLPSGFGADLAVLNSMLTSNIAPEAPFPVTFTEFNTRTASSFDTISVTLDLNSEYSRLGGICVNLMENGCSELYAFKFSQTAPSGAANNPVIKNAMHYVDNTNSPYNIGGITKAGEVYRLFINGFSAGRNLMNVTQDVSVNYLDVQSSYDPIRQCYYLYSANSSNTTANLSVDLSSLNIPSGNQVLVREVSDSSYGGVGLWTNLSGGSILNYTQAPYTVLLFTIPAQNQTAEQLVSATEDAGVLDGSNKAINFNGSNSMIIRNDPSTANNRGVAFAKFHLPTNNFSGLQFALLSLQASCANVSTTVQAHVYVITNTAWSQSSLTWTAAPNLAQGVAPGSNIASGFLTGIATNASIVGQLVVTSTNTTEKLIDITDYLRTFTNSDLSFLIAQTPRWDVTLPSMVQGDTQPDGIRVLTLESGNGARLRLVFNQPTNQPGYYTNIVDKTEACVRGGANATIDQSESASGYIMVKYDNSPFDNARKGYFQFDLTGLSVDPFAPATLTFNISTNFQQYIQLWGLNQPYLNFTSAITWNGAQANDLAADDMLTNGAFTATAIGDPVLIPVSGTKPYSFSIPQLGPFIQSNHITFALSTVTNAANNAGGFRTMLTNTILNLRLLGYQPPQIAGLTRSNGNNFTVQFNGTSNLTYRVQAATTLSPPNWLTISTNVADGNGKWSVNDLATNATRFYRAVIP